MSKIIRFIGDIHGNYHKYLSLVNNGPECSIQLGDMGVGFGSSIENTLKQIDEAYNAQYDHKFIRGNHDNLSLCKSFGTFIEDGSFSSENGLGIFYLGGAFSVDQYLRTEGIDWWRDEELSYSEFDDVVADYEKYKPQIMVTHDCPDSIKHILVHWDIIPTRTGSALTHMLSIHKPKLWVFGHHHRNLMTNIDGTQFLCVRDCDYVDIDVMSYK